MVYAAPLAARVRRLQQLVEDENGCGLLLAQPGMVAWATGLRSLSLLVARDTVYALTPPLEALRVSEELEHRGLGGIVELAVYQPYRLPGGLELGVEARVLEKGFAEAVAELLGRQGCRLLVDGVSVDLYEKLSKSYTVTSVSGRLWEMRMVKEWWEVERMEEAARIAEAALVKAVNSLSEGVSEADIAATIEAEMMRLGAQGHSFPTIVAFDDNTVYPHAEPTNHRRLFRGSTVLIDLGAVYRGYCSDMTRTLCFGGCSQEVRRILEAVDEAVGEAVDSVEPGKRAEEVDATARKVLSKYGLDRYFIHSLGHGVGVEVHEEPRLSPGSRTELKPGTVVTVEPGVYIPSKRVGVRIEEMVLVTGKGARLLTRLSRLL